MTSTPPPSTITAACVVWNGAAHLRLALESALAQTRPPEELFVVDDGSSDGSADLAEAMGVRVFREPHRGVAAARNVALRHARGDLIAWLDADDRWMPDKLAVQGGHMDVHPEIGVTMTHQIVVREPGAVLPKGLDETSLHTPTIAFGTCSMMVRRAAHLALGGFDERLVAGEDTEWLIRAKRSGVDWVVLPQVLLERRFHSRNLTTTTPLAMPSMLRFLRRAVERRRVMAAPLVSVVVAGPAMAAAVLTVFAQEHRPLEVIAIAPPDEVTARWAEVVAVPDLDAALACARGDYVTRYDGAAWAPERLRVLVARLEANAALEAFAALRADGSPDVPLVRVGALRRARAHGHIGVDGSGVTCGALDLALSQPRVEDV